MHNRIIARFLSIVLLMVSAAIAQESTGTISGAATDHPAQ